MLVADIIHQLAIKASAENIFDAITTQQGLSAWWTTDAEAEPKAGSVAVFGFYERTTIFRMAVKELDRGCRVAWDCLGDHEEWKETQVIFDLRPAERVGETVLRFKHAGWRSANGWMATCSTTWAHVLERLKHYAEKGKRVPYFTG